VAVATEHERDLETLDAASAKVNALHLRAVCGDGVQHV
jgi:hypothetical protein